MAPKKDDKKKEAAPEQTGPSEEERELVEKELLISYLKSKLGRCGVERALSANAPASGPGPSGTAAAHLLDAKKLCAAATAALLNDDAFFPSSFLRVCAQVPGPGRAAAGGELQAVGGPGGPEAEP